ncbi:MAG: MBL fold metallo-hydrolase [Hyphomonadaceae bacterium]|nr:MBL fold metallo-hydrolase [Hyphomonadaceae bacterium]
MRLRGALFIIAILALAVAGAAFAFQRPIGEALFARTAQRAVGVDRAAALPDGLHVYLCGTGSPFPDPTRAGPCVGVLAGERAFIIDAGSGSMRVLARMGFPLQRLERVYLTHLHSDHIDGLGEAMLQAWIGGARAAPLPIAGPAGTAEVVAGFNQVYRIDSAYRVGHHGAAIANPDGYGATAEEIVVPEGASRVVVVRDGDLTITAILVGHAPVAPAFGYRIDYKGRSLAVSGDTIRADAFIAAAEGVDVMLHDALNPRLVAAMGSAAAANGQANLAQVMTDIQDYHASPEDAARVAESAGARALVLTHIVPPLPLPFLHAAFLGDARALYGGDLRVGADGVLISMPADSATITFSQALR